MKITIEYDGATDVVQLSAVEVQALENDLLDPADWVKKAIAGKVSKCTKRMARAETQRLLADPDVDTMPADNDGLVASAVAVPNYKNRVARDAAEAS
tara:strand:+ start:2673 stop:2963 length:291 start_codon:yes stop_codon:yes gene_type:complete